MTPADIASSLEALSLIANDNSLVDKLYDNISYVQDLLQQNNIDINLTTPIVPIIVHSNEKALQIAQKLYENILFYLLSVHRQSHKTKADCVLLYQLVIHKKICTLSLLN